MEGSMRILEVSASGTIGTHDMGPVSTGVCRLSNGFARRGHEVTVIDATTADARTGLDTRVRVVTVPRFLRHRHFVKLPSKVQLLYTWIHALLYFWSLRHRLDLREFDVVHVHEAELACLFGLLSRLPYCYTSHSTAWALEAERGASLSLFGRFEKSIECFAIRRSRMSIGLGDYLRKQLPGTPVTTIPNGIEPARWAPGDKRAARRALGVADDEFVVVFAGRVHPSKGVDLLVEAVRLLASSMQGLRVFAIGSLSGDFHSRTETSPYAANVMDRAKGLPVQFTGFVANHSPQFRTYLAAADVAVFPSRVEPFGNVALEALAMSVPVIAARTGGLAEIVSEDVGVLVPPNDVDALAAAIRDAHAQPEKLAMRRVRCRKRVMEKYTVEQFVERYVAVFERDQALFDRDRVTARGSAL
jgi:glycosyltransferase involved in cell wall biosynthesis